MSEGEASTDPREQFLDQFEWDGGDWLYRFNSIGAAYRVSDAEKDAFVAAYDRGRKMFVWVVAPIVILLFAALIYADFSQHRASRDGGSNWIIGFVVAQVVRFVADYFILRAPLRQLRDRIPVAPPIPKPERRRRRAEGIQETLIIGLAVAALAMLYLQIMTTGLSADWKSLAWTAAAGALLALAIGLGLYKWVLGRGDQTPSIFT